MAEILPKGKACLSCRTRKSKCDGVKPSCGRCTVHQRLCEYRERSTKEDVLEVQVAGLTNRLRILEMRRVKLSSPALSVGIDDVPVRWWEADEPPEIVSRALLNAFLENSHAVGFFLNKEKLKAAVYNAAPFCGRSRPLPYLLNAIYLWGIALSASSVLLAQEPLFLSRSLSQIGSPSQHQDDPLQRIQTHILLSNYFMRSCHTSEGKSHSNTAMWFAIRNGFHKPAMPPSGVPSSSGAVDPADKVAAFWAAFYLDKCWSLLLAFPSACPDQRNPTDEHRIDIPWPIDVDKPMPTHVAIPRQSIGTVTRFLNDPLASHAEEGVSFTAMECKAITLLNQICDFVSLWNPNLDAASRQLYFDGLLRKSQVIDRFHGTIAPVTPGNSLKSNARLLVVHTYICLATIRLGIFDSWKRKRLESAVAVANILEDVDVFSIGYVHPVVGKLLMVAARVLLEERKTTTDVGSQEEVSRALDSLESFLVISAMNCPYIHAEYASFESEKASLSG
ncbi:hypothetical protein BDM02DRAFT_3235476 [Thelephora ganbajun]|uniref:Uncharacterized protein n=1 Tax=Thelephora ganbajun TaxID=370292 RepID=A0ACB6ZH09_THEGA|nr:hypothetical protein BDM02DRAFT_3235476 [Thelephora ganbajun]